MIPAATTHSVPPIRNAGLLAKLMAATEEPRLELDWFLDVHTANASFERGLLHAGADLVGTSFEETVHPGDLEALFTSFAEAMCRRAVSLPLRFVRADRTVVATVCEVTLVRGGAGRDDRFDLRVRLATADRSR